MLAGPGTAMAMAQTGPLPGSVPILGSALGLTCLCAIPGRDVQAGAACRHQAELIWEQRRTSRPSLTLLLKHSSLAVGEVRVQLVRWKHWEHCFMHATEQKAPSPRTLLQRLQCQLEPCDKINSFLLKDEFCTPCSSQLTQHSGFLQCRGHVLGPRNRPQP